MADKVAQMELEKAPKEGDVVAARGIRFVRDSKGRLVERRVAATLEEARREGWDFFHPQLGWIRRGFKREQEYPEQVGETYSPDS